MKRILLTLAALVSIHSFTEAQNFGIDIATPAQKLDVAGAMRLGTTPNGVAGSLRWTGTEFQFHDGTQWNTLSGNSDNQNLDVFNLSGTNLELSLQNDGQATQTVNLSGFMDNTDDQTLDVFTLNGTDLELSLEDDGQATQTLDLDPLRRLLLDADTDTKVQVEESADEDIIRFDLEATERWVMVGSRLEPKNSGNSVFIGSNSGAADNLTSTNRNTAVGTAALSTNISGGGNVAMGSQALTAATSSSNTAVGKSAMIGTTTGTDNVAVGKDALLNNLGGSENVAIGESSSIGVTSGTQNTVLGAKAGTGGTGTRSGNVYLGYNAGTGATGSNQLFIENSNSANPLIYGEFDNDLLRVNGTLNVNNAYDLPTADGTTGYVISTDGSGTATFQDPTTLLATGLNTLDEAYDEGGAGAGRIITADNGAVEIQGAGGLVNEGNLTMTTDDAWVGIGASAGRIVFDQTANPDRLNVSDANVGMEDGNWIGVDASSPRMVFNDTDGEVDIANANIEIDEDKWIGASGATERIQFEGVDDEINILGATGGVGIGTSDPTTELDVNGKIRMRTGSTVGFIPVGDANGVMTWTDPQTLSVLSLEDADGDTKVQVEESADEDYIRFDTFGTERMLIHKTGNIGVGLGAGDFPARILDVEEATGAKVVIGRDGATTTGDVLGELHFDGKTPGGAVSSVDASAMLRATAAEPQTINDKGADLSFYTKAIDANGNAAATEHMRIASTGDVGVGTLITATEKLDVDGKIRMRTGASVGYVPVSDANGVMTWTDLDGSGLGDNLGDHVADMNLQMGDFNVLDANTVEANTLLDPEDGTLTVADNLAVTGDVTVQGSDIRDDSGNLRLSAEDDLYLSMDYNNNDANTRAIMFGRNDEGGDANFNELMRIQENGNVGIGTNGPSAKLDVVGVLELSDVAPIDPGSDIVRLGDGGSNLQVQTNGGYTKIGAEDALFSHFRTDRNRYYFEREIRVDEGLIGSYDENLSLQTQGTTRVTALNSNGYVGVGTAAPDQRLDVNGGLRVTSSERNEGLLLTAGGTNGQAWSRIFMEENNLNTFGFSIVHNGDAANTILNYPSDYFGISRHDNYAPGVIALGISRSTGEMTIGNLAGGADKIVMANASGTLYPDASLVGNNGDDLGNHTATTNLNMGNREVDNINYLDMRAADNYALRFWSDNQYAIAMGNAAEYHYGPVTDYSIKMGMSNTTTRGWTWGVDGVAPVVALNTQGHMQVQGNMTAIGDFSGRSTNFAYSNIYRMGGMYFTWDSDSYGTNIDHSIRSTYGNGYGDHITLNSYGHIRFNIDADNNGTNYFEIGNATTGTGNIRVRINEAGSATFADDIYLRDGAADSGDNLVRIYDSNDDGVIDIYENNAMNIRLHGNGTTIFNDQQISTNDLRMEGVGQTYSFFHDASTSLVGLRTSAPSQVLDVNGEVRIRGGSPAPDKMLTATSTNGTATWQGSGVSTTYIRWGRDDCPSGNTLNYWGYVAGGYYNHTGSGANTLCLTSSPNWTGSITSTADNNGGLLYGTEFQGSGYGVSSYGGNSSAAMQDFDARCASCIVPHGTSLMIPGTTQCPSGWTRQYYGYLMSTHYTQRKSEFVCMDVAPDRIGNNANQNGHLWYPVEAELGSLHSPYQQNREVVCALCTK